MNDGDDVATFINEFSMAVDKLSELGISLGDELVVIILISSLPKAYENFVVAIESRDTLPSLSALKIKLMEEATRRKSAIEVDGMQQAYMVRSASNKLGGNKKAKRCFKCNKRGHFAANCSEKTKDQVHSAKGKDDVKPKGQKALAILAAQNFGIVGENVWVLDSGATTHMSCKKQWFRHMKAHEEAIHLANDNQTEAKGIGDVEVSIKDRSLLFKDTLFVPKLKGNFLSVRKMVQRGAKVVFMENHADVICDGEVVLSANRVGDLFVVQVNGNKCFSLADETTMTWHNRYGHLNFQSLKQLHDKEMVSGIGKIGAFDGKCGTCMKAKVCSLPYQRSENRATELLELVHTDLCGPMQKFSLGGSKYFLLFTDDYSRFMVAYFIKTKDEVYEKFLSYKKLVERQTGKNIKRVRSDNGGEFVNARFDKLFEECGIARQLTVPYTPQQNGVAERANRTIGEMARSMLVHSGLPEALWAEAVSTAVYLRNRSPTKHWLAIRLHTKSGTIVSRT